MIIKKYFHTLKYLKLKQLIFLVARKFRLKKILLNSKAFNFKPMKYKILSISITRSSCNKMNLKHSFNDVIQGFVEQKLYLYNIFYMNDYSDKSFLTFHKEFYKTKSIFLEPYPTSIRIVNLLYYSDLTDRDVISYLKKDVKNLSQNLEYELDGNHLLENCLALSLYELIIGNEGKFTELFTRLLKEQFIDCEWHFEQSPMYQAILLERMQCYLAVLNMFKVIDNSIIDLVKVILVKGVRYLELFHVNSTMLHFNDSTGGNSLSIGDLKNNNNILSLSSPEAANASELIKNGFARIESPRKVLVVDTSKILANHIPGHIHSATGTFWLLKDGEPFIVNNAISTYQENNIRALQRGSSFHNCIVPTIEFNEVWGSFRVARRADSVIEQHENQISLYSKLLTGQKYSRTFSLEKCLTITDKLDDCDDKLISYLYFHESVSLDLITKHVHSSNIYCIDRVDIPIEYNKTVSSYFIYFKFSKLNSVRIQ